jgi:hypothetical protein
LQVAVRGDGPRCAGHDEIVNTHEIVEKLVEKGLPRVLNTDREGHMWVHQLLLEGGLDDSDVSLSQIFILRWWIDLLVEVTWWVLITKRLLENT